MERAIRALQKALSIDPSHVKSKFDLALCYEKKKDYGQARVLLEEITRQQPDLVSAHVVLARIDHRLGKKEEEDSETAIIWRLNVRRMAEEKERIIKAKELLSQPENQKKGADASKASAPHGVQFAPR